MKIFHCSYCRYFGYGAYDDYDCIAVAECESVALGLCLMNYKDTIAKHWSVYEIETTKRIVVEIADGSI